MGRLSLILNKSGLKTLGALDVDGLDVRVELLSSSLLVVTLAGDADAKSEWAALDTGLPDLLVQLWVDADIGGTLEGALVCGRMDGSFSSLLPDRIYAHRVWVSYHGLLGESLDLLDGLWCTLLERDTMEL